jgi:hypothetical protein
MDKADKQGRQVGQSGTDTDRLSPQYDEALCTLHHKASEFVTQDSFDLVFLFDTRIEFTYGSISTRPFSLQDTVRGLRRTSREALRLKMRVINSFPLLRDGDDLNIPDLYYFFQPHRNELSQSLREWLKLTSDEKFSKVSAAVSDDLTAVR